MITLFFNENQNYQHQTLTELCEKKGWEIVKVFANKISGAVNFICNDLNPELREEFIKDCDELEELRGWIWERHNNHLRSVDDAKKDYREWMVYIENKLSSFCEKYKLNLNED